MFKRLSLALLAAWFAATAAVAQTSEAADAAAIRHVMKSTWDKPTAAVDASPIVVGSDYAIAGWTQGDMGGRALLRKKAGAWSIILCAGDQLKDAHTLRMAGIADGVAHRLVTALADSESRTPPERIAMFSRFEGLVAMDGHGAHPARGH